MSPFSFGIIEILKLGSVEYPFCRVGKLHPSQQESFNSSDLFVKSGITVFRVILSIWKDENHLEPLLERMYNKGIFLFVFDDKIKKGASVTTATDNFKLLLA